MRIAGQRAYTLTDPIRALLERNQDQADEPRVIAIQSGTNLESSQDQVTPEVTPEVGTKLLFCVCA